MTPSHAGISVPGLIEGAHTGHGLGIQFLRHVERTRLLAHLVDVSEATGRDPVHDFEVVMAELSSFSDDLAHKPMIVVATKLDRIVKARRIGRLRQLEKELGLPRVVGFSAHEGLGKDEVWARLLEAVHG